MHSIIDNKVEEKNEGDIYQTGLKYTVIILISSQLSRSLQFTQIGGDLGYIEVIVNTGVCFIFFLSVKDYEKTLLSPTQ